MLYPDMVPVVWIVLSAIKLISALLYQLCCVNISAIGLYLKTQLKVAHVAHRSTLKSGETSSNNISICINKLLKAVSTAILFNGRNIPHQHLPFHTYSLNLIHYDLFCNKTNISYYIFVQVDEHLY